jgi:hypothetical protein
VEIYEAKNHSLLSEFITRGEGHVYFLQFGAALDKALMSATIHLAKYISKGKTSF